MFSCVALAGSSAVGAALAQGDALPAAAAQGATEPISIEYSADPGCPSAEDFRRLVFERTHSARLANGSEPARVFRAELRKRGRRFTGSLVIIEPDGASVARRVNGKRCDEVATVLALASALAIDPHAQLAPGETLEEQEELQGEAAAAEPSSSDPTYEDTYTPPSLSATESPPLEWRLGVALGPRVVVGVAPKASLGGGMLLASFFGRGAAHGSLGVELAALGALPEDVGGATATFQFFVARPRACPVALPTGDIGGLAPCVAVELGLLNAQGSDLPVTASSQRFWAAFELALRWDVSLGEMWFIQAEAAAQLPLSRYEFVFDDPETPVHRIPPAAGVATVRFGLRR